MDLFDMKLRLRYQDVIHSDWNKSAVLNVYTLQILKAVVVQLYRKSLLTADQLHEK